MKLLDRNDPFFRRAGTRWATVAVPLLWAGFELWMGNPFWAAISAAIGAYAFWVLILNRG